MRRLRAPDKRRAGEASAVLMEERETEEVGGEKQEKYSHRQRGLPATEYRGKKLLLQLPSLSPTSLGPREGLPCPRDNAGTGEGIFFM